MSDSAAFVHPKALVEQGAVIGQGTRIWAFAHVLSGVVIGSDCNICDHTFVEGSVKIGDRVTIKCGVYLWDGIEVADDVHIGPCVSFANDLRPRSKHDYKLLKTLLNKGCSIGANATLLPGIVIGAYAMIGAGSVVTRVVPAHALMVGNPARLRGWVCRCGEKLSFDHDERADCCGIKYSLRGQIVEVDDVS